MEAVEKEGGKEVSSPWLEEQKDDIAQKLFKEIVPFENDIAELHPPEEFDPLQLN
jgi:hypothetical protein